MNHKQKVSVSGLLLLATAVIFGGDNKSDCPNAGVFTLSVDIRPIALSDKFYPCVQASNGIYKKGESEIPLRHDQSVILTKYTQEELLKAVGLEGSTTLCFEGAMCENQPISSLNELKEKVQEYMHYGETFKQKKRPMLVELTFFDLEK